VAFVAGEDFDAGPVTRHPGGADEDGTERLVADPLDLEVGLEALQLAAESVALGGRVDQPEVAVVADDQPGAGSEDGTAGGVVLADRALEAGRGDPLRDRRALAAGYDQCVEPFEIGRDPNLAGLGSELRKGPQVGFEPTLDG